MIVPNPIESEKKACPSAAAHAFASIFEKSGLKRYARPSPAPGSVMEYIAMPSTMTNRIGIIILLNFSIPPLTPAATITAVPSKKIV